MSLACTAALAVIKSIHEPTKLGGIATGHTLFLDTPEYPPPVSPRPTRSSSRQQREYSRFTRSTGLGREFFSLRHPSLTPPMTSSSFCLFRISSPEAITQGVLSERARNYIFGRTTRGAETDPTFCSPSFLDQVEWIRPRRKRYCHVCRVSNIKVLCK